MSFTWLKRSLFGHRGSAVTMGFLVVTAMISLSSCANTTGSQGEPNPNEATSETATAVPQWTADSSIGSIVADCPKAARIFELLAIDYCCGGDVALGDAAVAVGADVSALLAALKSVGSMSREGSQRDLQQMDLEELMEHIVSTHHTWLRRELPRLSATAQTVLKVHGDSHSELTEVVAIIDRIQEALLPHLEDEELRVFPAVVQLEAGLAPEGVSALLEEMLQDHESIGVALHRLRELTGGFVPPEGACAKYREMLNGLVSLERDLHMHVHLENNVLLPRARALLDAK